MKLKLSSLLNRLKSYTCEIIKRVNLVHRLDYDKHCIWLHDNIRLNACKKEPDTVKWIETFKKDDVAFDIGANIGAYSLIMAKYAKTVFAAEPSVFTFSTLIKNIYTNRASNIIPLNIAFGDKTRLEDFFYSSTALGSSCHSLGKIPQREAYKQNVLAYTLNQFVRDFNIPSVQHLKIDVDGTEFEIIKAASGIFSNLSFKSLLVEINYNQEQEIFDFLKQFHLRNIASYPLAETSFNYLFTR